MTSTEATTQFESPTQYDNDFNFIWEIPGSVKGYGCPYFCLVTMDSFLKTRDVSADQHRTNIVNGNMISARLGTYEETEFCDVLELTNQSTDNIRYATVGMINSGEFDLEEFFDNDFSGNAQCVLVLKNGRFFVVMIDQRGWFVRDCHEAFQYNFLTKDDFIKHLNEAYNFNTDIVIGGEDLSKYSAIEMIKVDSTFMVIVNEMLDDAAEHEIEYDNAVNSDPDA